MERNEILHGETPGEQELLKNTSMDRGSKNYTINQEGIFQSTSSIQIKRLINRNGNLDELSRNDLSTKGPRWSK